MKIAKVLALIVHQVLTFASLFLKVKKLSIVVVIFKNAMVKVAVFVVATMVVIDATIAC